MIEDKDWGTKEVLTKTDFFQIDILDIKSGGYCSKHKHFHKYNTFYVLEGVLKLTLFLKEDKTKVIILNRENPIYTIRPGTFHKFNALMATRCLEYSFVRYTEDDIFRLDKGGIDEKLLQEK